MLNFEKLKNRVNNANPLHFRGLVTEIIGLTIQSRGPRAGVGELVYIQSKQGVIPAEVVGFKSERTLLMPLGDLAGVAPGDLVTAVNQPFKVKVGPEIIGRVLDGLGRPLDNKGALKWESEYPLLESPPHPLKRKRITENLSLGIKVIDGLLTCGKGQRLGIFREVVWEKHSFGMSFCNSSADVNVIALIGERGREVREFLENDLKAELTDRWW